QDRGSYSANNDEELAQAMRESGRTVFGLATASPPSQAPTMAAAQSPAPSPGAGLWGVWVGTFKQAEAARRLALALLSWNARVFLTPGAGGGGSTRLFIGGLPSAADATALWQRLAANEDTSPFLESGHPLQPGRKGSAPPPQELDHDMLGSE